MGIGSKYMPTKTTISNLNIAFYGNAGAFIELETNKGKLFTMQKVSDEEAAEIMACALSVITNKDPLFGAKIIPIPVKRKGKHTK